MRMHKTVYTVTLNPSIDVTLWVDGIDQDAVNHVMDERREAGGKGINVSRVLHAFDVDNLCVALAGEENRQEFSAFLQRDELRFSLLETTGAVRENITLRFGDETVKLNRRGPSLSVILLGALMSFLTARIRPGDIAVFAGSLPENMKKQDYIELILAAKNAGALVAVDNDCLTTEDYRRISPWLTKPNIHELQHIAGRVLSDEAELLKAAKELHDVGAQNVSATLGGEGMLLLNDEVCLRAKVPVVPVKSTVGAGDSALAGFIIGKVKGYTPEDTVRLSCACGVAATVQEGTEVADRATTLEWMPQIELQSIE